jgi:hypothetical protein
MITKDFLMRSIEAFMAAIARIIAHKLGGDYRQARQEMDRTCTRFVGLEYATAKDLSPELLVDLVKAGGPLDLHRSLMLAELLIADGEITELEQEPQRAKARYVSALALCLEDFPRRADKTQGRAHQKIQWLLIQIPPQEISANIKAQLLLYYETMGNLATAEDLLFELIGADPSHFVQTGIAFYHRLLKQSNNFLEQGNLPRQEVLEGLEEIQRKSTYDYRNKM